MSTVFETERLELREFAVEDATGFHALNADPEVLRYTGDRPFRSVAEAEESIRAYRNYHRDGFGRWSVFLRGTGEHLGFCGLNYRPQLDEVDIGFRLARSCWGQGYATEAARGSLRHGFDVHGLDRIVGRARSDNLASHGVLAKLGMRVQKTVLDPDDATKWVQYEIRHDEFVR
jgi:[ribosomal protein S5]-alanine N-acetyltransferase